MSPGSGKPLFDLISGSTQHEVHGDGGLPPRADRDRRDTGRLVLPVTWLYLAVAGVIVLVVAAYGVGYRVGASAERAEMQQFAARDADRVFNDPLGPSGGMPGDQAGAVSGGGAQAETGRDGGLEAPGGAAGGTGAGRGSGMEILTADGPVAQDPRIVGSNYLELATLPREDAIAAVRYLASHDEPAIAVPGVDRRRSGRNTSGRYRVIALGLAVTGDRFSSSKAEREQFERRLARLGRAWADEGGASDFSDPLWRRFGG